MGYKQPVTIRQEFPELFKGAFVEIRNPRLLSAGEVRALDHGDDQDDVDRGRLLLAHLILDWNLPPTDVPNGKPLPVPPSVADLDRLPALVYFWLLSESDISPNGKA